MKYIFSIIIIVLLASFCYSMEIKSDDVHRIEKTNLVYVITNSTNPSERDFTLSLKDTNQDIILGWTKADLVQNDKNTYKMYIDYSSNFKEGLYSLVVTDSNEEVTTKDIEVRHTNIFERIWDGVCEVFSEIAKIF